MPEHRKYCTEDFKMTRVMMRPPTLILYSRAFYFMVTDCCYIFVIRALFFRNGLGLAFSIMILVMMMILKTQKRTVTIYLDEKSLFLNVTYLRRQIDRFVTYNDERIGPVRTDFRIRLKNGTNLYITDTRLFGSADQNKGYYFKNWLKL